LLQFDSLPSLPDGYANDMRQELGIKNGTTILLQPTRIVPRKKIERAIALARRMDTEYVLVVAHKAGDEEINYQIYFKEFANLIGVSFLCAADRFAYRRPVIMEAYEIFKCDIQPKGFKVIWFEDFISREIVEDVQKILCNHELAIEWAEKNYQLGCRYYSYQTLEKKLVTLLEQCTGNL